MEWSAPPLSAGEAWRFERSRHDDSAYDFGIDLGKHWCHLIGLDARGATMLRKQLHRGHRAERHRRDGSVSGLPGRGPDLRRQAMKCGSCITSKMPSHLVS